MRSHVTGLTDGLSMNLGGRAQKLQEDANDLCITADDLDQAIRSDAGSSSVRALKLRTFKCRIGTEYLNIVLGVLFGGF